MKQEVRGHTLYGILTKAKTITDLIFTKFNMESHSEWGNIQVLSLSSYPKLKN